MTLTGSEPSPLRRAFGPTSRQDRNDPVCFSPHLYRARNLIERFFNKIKQCRRVATRYDKLAANYLAFIKLASIRIWLRANGLHLRDSATVRVSHQADPLTARCARARQGLHLSFDEVL